MPSRSRQRLWLGGVVLVASVGLSLGASHALPGSLDKARAAGAGRPNIILIQTDDQTLWEFQPGVMPEVTRLLQRRGTTFADYIATTAECCPSRASLITGQYAHNHGVTSNHAAYAGLTGKRNVLPVWLRRAGYRTMHVGKFLNGYQMFAHPPSRVGPGWSEWYTPIRPATHYYDYRYSINGEVHYHRHRRNDNITRVLGSDAVRLIKAHAPQRRPFYLELDQRAPHVGLQDDPYGPCDRAAMPVPADEHRFRHARLPRPPSFNEADVSDKPGFLRSAPRFGSKGKRSIRHRWRCALASLVGVDRDVGKVYRAVKRAGELNKTVFIFISDNGLFFGEHRMRSGKVLPYEEAVHLPLVIKVPRRYRGGAGRVQTVRQAVANIDLAPTILALAGGRPCSSQRNCRTMDGRSLIPLLTRSHRWPRDRGLLTEYRVADAARYQTCKFAGIRTRDDIYIKHSRVVNPASGECVAADQRERYDLDEDPFELHNRCFGGDASNCPVSGSQVNLEVRLNRLRHCAGIRGRDQRVGGRPFCE